MRCQLLVTCGLLLSLGSFEARATASLRSRPAVAIPPMFEENRGQFSGDTRFLTRRNGLQVSFEPGSIRIVSAAGSPVKLSFWEGVNPEGLDRLNAKLNYFYGSNAAKWVRGAEAFRKIEYRSGTGSSLLFYWNAKGDLEFDLTLAPDDLAAQSSFRLSGETSALISPMGDLVLKTGETSLTLRKPVVYQMLHGVRHMIDCRYTLGEEGLVGFELGKHDERKPVTIDPTLSVTAGTYLGGSGGDSGKAVAVDSSGNMYLAGYTQSTDFPVSNAYQSTLNGPQDAFIAELNASGSQLIFATYLGGSALDTASGISLDGSGNIYAGGVTYSTDFPLVNPPIPQFPAQSGHSTGWVAKFSPGGSTLVYSTYLGGSTYDSVNAVAADSVGNLYVTGQAYSNNFPVMNGYQTVSQNPAGYAQPFLTKFSSSGAITYSTITNAFEGNGVGVATDNHGVAVFVSSAGANAPVKNAFQPANGGYRDAYIVKVDTTQTGASSLLFATYLGGLADDLPAGVALDSSGNVYLAGTTGSANFPLQNAYQASVGNSFVTKIASSGTSLIFSTYFDGSIYGIATDAAGNAYITGFGDSSLPQVNALPGQTGPSYVASFSTIGSLIYSTFVGSTSDMYSFAIAASGAGDVILTGSASVGLPVTAAAYQPNSNGTNAFAVRLTYSTPAVISANSVSPQQGGDAGVVSVTVRGSNILAGATVALQSPAATITPFSSVVASDGRSISGMFDLRHEPDGPYNVIVTNPDSTTATLTQAFTVIAGGAPQLNASITGGADLLQGGGVRDFTVVVSNTGTADAYAVPVVAEVGLPVMVQVQAAFLQPAQNPGTPPIDYSQVPTTVTGNSSTFAPLVLPWIPAGGSAYFRLVLTSPPAEVFSGGTVPLSIHLGSPLLAPDPNASLNSSATMGVRAMSLRAQDAANLSQLQAFVNSLIATPQGQKCLLNLLQLALQILKVAPGGNCAEGFIENLLKQQLTSEVFTVLQGAAQGGQLSTADVAGQQMQTDLSILSLVLKCAEEGIPLSKVINALIAAWQVYQTIEACLPLFNHTTTITVQVVSSHDPNEKNGPPGAGSQMWISGANPSTYSVAFENQASATAPAGKVVVTDQLNSQLFNLASFSFGPIAFGSTLVTPTPGVNSYSTNVDLRPNINTIVAIKAGIDNTGLITWTFQSLDPISGQPITDPTQGFLPPNTTPPEGQGSVSFFVNVNQGLTTGTAIPNQATVVFDFNSPITTNVWQNTIDNTPPVSSVGALNGNQNSNVFTVSWSGSDVGSGVQTYTIFNSVNGGPWVPWVSGTAATSASCVAAPNSTQAFFAIATDAAGNVENGKKSAETTTQVANVEAVTIATVPAGLPVSIDNQPAQLSPVNVVWQVGGSHAIAVPASQPSGGTLYTFANWSDNGAASHTVTATAGVSSYTATFNTSYLLTALASPSQGGTLSLNPQGTNGYYPAGTQVNVTATANPGYLFTGWTGNVASSSSAATSMILNQPQTIMANFVNAGVPSLGSSISAKAGPSNARVWTIAFNNGGSGTALSTSLNSFHLAQTFGAACTPVVSTAVPLSVGNIAAGTSGTAVVTINFTGCAASARFTASYSYSAANETTITKTFLNQFQ